MKILQFILVAFTSGALAYSPIPLEQFLTDAQTAMTFGDFETARSNFQWARNSYPDDPVAVAGLKRIEQQEKNGGGGAVLRTRLATIIIPQFELKEASLSEALDLLKVKVTKKSGGKQAVNVVVQPDAPPSAKEAKITLNLVNIPVTEVIKYLAMMVNAEVGYQKNAFVLYFLPSTHK